MNQKDLTEEELEEELDKAFKSSDSKRDVFKIIRDEKESLEVREKRVKKKFKF
ncbi:MAG: hypothetical protein KGD65_12005 [Candidatus Lokiarchaeota archaeon]|nr:hypothetical protein [Candidatus Lokiarchaeota archaeon]